MEEGCSPVISRTEIDYKRPLTIRDTPSGRLWIKSMGVTKWTMGFEIFQGDTIHCQGQQTGYFLNIKTGRQRDARAFTALVKA